MACSESDECWILTCNVWALLTGQIFALAYMRLMFGTEHIAGQPPKYCAFNIEPRGLPVRMIQGSLYLWNYRIHHWVFYSVLFPLFVLLQWYGAMGFCTVMITHGLWYDDRFEFRYDETQYARQAKEEAEVAAEFELDDRVDQTGTSTEAYACPAKKQDNYSNEQTSFVSASI